MYITLKAKTDFSNMKILSTVKLVSNGNSQKSNNGFQDHLSLNAGQEYCRMLQGECSATLSTFVKLSFVTKIFVLSILSSRLTQVLELKVKTQG